MRVLLIAILCIAVVQGFYLDRWLDENKESVKEKGGNIWVLLVAGSSGWYNYRHQADICHIYKILTKKHGIPERYIVTMMFNDIAYNDENKRPGQIINSLNGKNVYNGVVIDYMDLSVTAPLFLHILQGHTSAVRNKGSGKVIASTSKDVIFVNFADHGGPGILAFPEDELHVEDLTKALQTMYKEKQYSQMLWYVEACYAGSMFLTLEGNMNITAHTASNADESSYACTYDDFLGVYLGDCWSLNWMNNTYQIFPDLEKETVGQQYEIVKKMTTTSHAMIYGDLKYIYNEPLSTFMGHGAKYSVIDDDDGEVVLNDGTRSEDVMMHYLRKKLERTVDGAERYKLQFQIEYHEETEVAVQDILYKIGQDVAGNSEIAQLFEQEPLDIKDMSCNKVVLSAFFDGCYKIQTHPYIGKYIFSLTNLCNVFEEDEILQAVAKYCGPQ